MARILVHKTIWLLLLCGFAAQAKPFFVATNGNDTWSGHSASRSRNGKDGPLATLEEAVRRTRNERSKQIFLRNGVHVLNEPVTLTAADSGLTISAYRDEKPTISGQTVITNWQRVEGSTNLWHAKVDDKLKAWVPREMFVNNRRKQRARTPNDGFLHLVGNMVDGQSNKVRYANNDINPDWAKSGEVELVAHQLWAGSRNRIVAVDTNTHVVTLGGMAITENKEDNGRYVIENTRDALDKPGEWFFDSKAGEIFCWPEPGEDLTKATVTVPHLSDLFVLQGTKEAPVHDVAFKQLIFADTDWRLATNGYCDVQAALHIRGVIRADFAKNCTIEKCEFTRLGNYAVDFNRGCQSNKVVGCVIHDIGAGGIRVGETSLKSSFANPTGHNEITDNHIFHIDLIYPPAVAVILFQTAGNHVAHNHIHDTFYTAISVGWSWGYEPTPTGTNIIEFNHLHDIGQKMLSDMGGIYTLGLEPRTILRNNLIHDVNGLAYGGWGLYTDEGSTGITLENNIVYRCGSANFHQHYGKENVVRNNIFAFGRDAQLVRTRPENHISFFFTNNIVFYNSGPLLTSSSGDTNFVIDHNIYFDTRPDGASRPVHDNVTWAEWKKAGHDTNSIFADPLFTNADKNDFTLKKDSPALKLGFKPIDMREVGVRRKFARKTEDETD